MLPSPLFLSFFYFNPRPRKEGDIYKVALKVEAGSISIHALVKRATFVPKSFPILATISIHALVKRATEAGSEPRKALKYFNPRPRKEGDIIFQILYVI